MRVYWPDRSHYICKEFTDESSEKIEYLFDRNNFPPISKGALTSLKHYFQNRPKNINIEVPTARERFDLIHTYGSLSPLDTWVTSFEDATAFTYLKRPNNEQINIVSSYLRNCDAILPLSEASKKSFLNLYNPEDEIEEKIEVVYPAFNPPEQYNTETESTYILFIARDFERKGGYEAYNAFKELNKIHDDLKFICVSDTPQEVVKNSPANCTFYENVSRDKLLELYRKSDLFVYPTFHDTFGFVMVEAMGFGCPVITLEDFATPEIVDNGQDGFIIEGYENKWFDKNKIRIDKYNNWEKLREKQSESEKVRIVEQTVRKVSQLIEDDKKREEFSKKAREKVEKGKFSIERKNRQMKRIYSEVLE